MKQKYHILNNNDQKELIIREFSELDDKVVLLLLVEQKYDVKSIEFAIKKGKKALTSILNGGILTNTIFHVVDNLFKEQTITLIDSIRSKT